MIFSDSSVSKKNLLYRNHTGKGKFYSGTVTIEEKRSQYRTGLNSEYRMDKWGFIAKEQGGGH